MPKDATKNVDRYKVRGGQLNEFDFARNQEQFAEQDTKITKTTKGAKSPRANKGGQCEEAESCQEVNFE